MFEKSIGDIVGFVDYGEESLNKKFVALQEQCKKQKGFSASKVATQMLTLMVCGIFFKFDFSLAHFSIQGTCIISILVSYLAF